MKHAKHKDIRATADRTDSAYAAGLHVLTEAELAQLLGCKRSEARQRLRWIAPQLRGHIRSCRGSRVVVTDEGLLALRRAKELEDLCFSPQEIVDRLRRELFPEPEDGRPERASAADDTAVQGDLSPEATTVDPTELGNAEEEDEDKGKEEEELLAPSAAASRQAPFAPRRAVEERLARAALAGLGATGAMTMGAMVGPLVGLPPMNVPAMLAGFLGKTLGAAFGHPLVGWGLHFAIGLALALLYAWVAERLPGPAPVRGALYGLFPFLLAQLIVMPMMGAGVFALATGSLVVAANSLLGHIVYGAVLGALYGAPSALRTESHTRGRAVEAA